MVHSIRILPENAGTYHALNCFNLDIYACPTTYEDIVKALGSPKYSDPISDIISRL